MKHRLVALDWMRGVVMILMTVDHASGAFNGGRLITPSLSFVALELGLMAVCLAGLFAWHARPGQETSSRNPVLVFGQTALLFYLLHIPLLELSSYALGVHRQLGLGTAYAASGVALALLYPVCRWYRGYKSRHPDGWPRYI